MRLHTGAVTPPYAGTLWVKKLPGPLHTPGGRAPSSVPPVSPAGGGTPVTDGPATEQVDNRQENDGPQQRDQERGEAEIVLIDGANAEERREHEPGDQGADNPHHDIQEQALLRIGAHDEAGNPPQDTPDDNPQNQVHGAILPA